MSIVNDFEITLHAKDVTKKAEYSPCQINVNSVFMATDLRAEDKSLDQANTRLDLKHLFNTKGVIVTAAAETGGCVTFRGEAKCALFIKETIEELNALKEDGRKAHLKMLRESRMNIV
ncbi:MAG: hypothetical protein NZ828_09835 [Alphaproteobacteria bacterium]|nr:hypothetical protein [Alphaproteobacteria bacterium]